MMEKYYELSEDERALIKVKLKEGLMKIPKLTVAYLHGSFVKAGRFRDIDIAIYLKDSPDSSLDLELQLEAKFGEAIHYPVDVRVLNTAPLSFRYNVIKDGQVIIVNDDDARTEFVEATTLDYLDFAPFRKMYLKEALGLGV